MADDSSKFWWIKLADEFLFGPECSFMMSQESGSDYVVLYEMICARFKKTNGRLIQVLGKIVIRFQVQEVYNEFKKWFDFSKVALAMELYKRLGLMEEEPDGTLFIPNFGDLIGCETLGARRKRKQRANKRINGSNQKLLSGTEKETSEGQAVGQCPINNNVDNNTTYDCGTDGGTMSRQRQTQNKSKNINSIDSLSDNHNSDTADETSNDIDAELEFYKACILSKIKEFLYDPLNPQISMRFQNYVDMLSEIKTININGSPHRAAEVISILLFYCHPNEKDSLTSLFYAIDAKTGTGEIFNSFAYTVTTLYNYAREHGATTTARRI